MKDPKTGEEKRKNSGLRLVPNPPAEESVTAEEQTAPRVFKSRLAQQLAAFAEQLDKDINEIMKI